jgi:hypothetical protein
MNVNNPTLSLVAPNSFYNASYNQSTAPANQTIVTAASNKSGVYIVAGQLISWITATGSLNVDGKISFGGIFIPSGVDFVFDPYDGTAIGGNNYCCSVYAGANLITSLNGYGAANTVQFQCAYRVL